MFKFSVHNLGFGSYFLLKANIYTNKRQRHCLCHCVNLTKSYCPLHIVECYFLYLSKQYLTDTIRVCIEIQMIRTVNWVISSY